VPGAFWLLASGLMAFVGFRRGFRGRWHLFHSVRVWTYSPF
jgi:hypothetical protein